MSNAGAVRAGGAFVEIFANDSKFQQAMTRIQNRVQTVGHTLQRLGTGMSLGGAALGAPLALAGRQAAGFEDAILAMQGAAGLSSDAVDRLAAAARRMGGEMGISPTTLAQGFLELAKAGMSVDEVLAGAGKSAAEFAKISGVDAERAAVFMKAAMNVFGVSSKEAVDTLTAAANSSETSIDAMVESFSQVGSAGQAFNQSLFGISQAMAVLAKSNIVGEEAGTAIKTMLTKLIAPTQDAEEALGRLGLKVSDFRDEAGKLLPMQQIAGVFERALGNMQGDPASIMASQQALVDVFEQRGIKVMTAFANAGEAGFKKVADEMRTALPVAQQFQIQMSGISGSISQLNQGVEQMSIAFGEAIGGPLKQTTSVLVGIMETVAALVRDFPILATSAAGVAAAMVAVGAAAIAAGIAMKGFAQVSMVLAALSGPRGWIALAAVALGGLAAYMSTSFQDAAGEVEKAKKEVEALGKGDGNSIKADENRKPMVGDPFAKMKAAEELAKEDAAFDEAQGKAVEKLQELSNSVVTEISGLGDAAFTAGVNFQQELAEIINKVRSGILNPNGAQVLADQAKAVFDADIERVRKGLEEKTRDFGPSLGTFGSGAGMGIGPQLAKFIEKAVVEQRQRPGANPAVAIGVGVGAGGAMGDSHSPNPEWIERQRKRAKAGADVAVTSVSLPEAFRSSMASVTAAVREQVKATEAGNKLLRKIADNSGKGLVFT